MNTHTRLQNPQQPNIGMHTGLSSPATNAKAIKLPLSEPVRLTALSCLLLSLSVFGQAYAQDAKPADLPDIIQAQPVQSAPDMPANLTVLIGNNNDMVNAAAHMNVEPGDAAADRWRYLASRTYMGYFNPEACYRYRLDDPDRAPYFEPMKFAGDAHSCTDDDAPWSGNFLNWATMQTVDGVRHVLTGGNRVEDTESVTILEKAHSRTRWPIDSPENWVNDGRDYDNAPARWLDTDLIEGATPFKNEGRRLAYGMGGFGKRLGFSYLEGGDNERELYNRTGENYDLVNLQDNTDGCDSEVCLVNVRVQVCKAGFLEENCNERYNPAKPEGLIQERADLFRFSLLSYANSNTTYNFLNQVGVLRVPPRMIFDEWDRRTGMLKTNPYVDIANETNTDFKLSVEHKVARSGFINYINQFGSQFNGNFYEGNPLGALYYTAMRYYRQMDITSYRDLPRGLVMDQQLATLDNHPILTNWEKEGRHPISESLWCQPNFILGIGSNNASTETKLPGSWLSGATGEVVSDDKEVSTDDLIRSIEEMEGTTFGLPVHNVNPNRLQRGSWPPTAALPALSWYMRSRNILPDNKFKQPIHVSTYWLDVASQGHVLPIHENILALSAKYGGVRLDQLDEEIDLEQIESLDFNDEKWESLWHTNGDTITPFGPRAGSYTPFKRPDNYFVGYDLNTLSNSMQQLFDDLSSEATRPSAGVGLAVNSTRLDVDNITLRAEYAAKDWTGDLIASTLTLSPEGQPVLVPTWKVSENLPVWSERKVFFNFDGTLKRFESHGELTSAQQAKIDSQAVLEYILGNADKELAPPGAAPKAGGVFRHRISPLGAIIHSQPVVVGAPNRDLYTKSNIEGQSTHANFATAQTDRRAVVYVGANDGMLHGFDLKTGVETFAFIPNQVIMNGLQDISRPDYAFKYFVDGELTVADVYISNSWRTVLVGTLGRGGPGIFALDVTNPDNVSLLWEKNGSDIPALGRNLGKPIIAPVGAGDWRVILGNGPDSPDRQAQLVTIDIGSGKVTSINTDAPFGNNGLSAAFTWDESGNGYVDTVYAGDLLGYVWRFKLSGSGTAYQLFQAKGPDGDPQPITAAPLIARQPGTNTTWVFVGTGQFLNSNDLIDNKIQTWYGLIDDGTIIVGRAELVERKILDEEIVGNFMSRTVSLPSDGDMAGKRGWFIDLKTQTGERMVVANQFRGRVLIGSTRIPDPTNLCSPGGAGFVMAINPFTGARLDRMFFDFTGDGKFDERDKTKTNLIPSGIGMPNNPNRPVFVSDIMQVVLDDSRIETIRTRGPASEMHRMSWRELLGN